MDGQENNSKYQDRMNKVCDYIDWHLDEDLSLDHLSKVANFSKYHFHRQFAVYTGVNLSRYIQLLRFKRASYQLVFNQDRPIIEIALDANFENPESFSRAFKSTFAQTPSQFRKDPNWQDWNQKYSHPARERKHSMEVQIVELADIKVAVFEHLGSPDLLNESIGQFIEWRKSSGLSPVDSSQTYGIPNGDPKTLDPKDFRFDICGTVSEDVPENPQGVITKSIPGGRFAVVRHLGSRDEMDATIYQMYGEWVPESGEDLRDFPCFFHYINLFPEVAEHELITDIYLPLK